MEIRNKLTMSPLKFLKKCISVCTGRLKEYDKSLYIIYSIYNIYNCQQ